MPSPCELPSIVIQPWLPALVGFVLAAGSPEGNAQILFDIRTVATLSTAMIGWKGGRVWLTPMTHVGLGLVLGLSQSCSAIPLEPPPERETPTDVLNPANQRDASVDTVTRDMGQQSEDGGAAHSGAPESTNTYRSRETAPVDTDVASSSATTGGEMLDSTPPAPDGDSTQPLPNGDSSDQTTDGQWTQPPSDGDSSDQTTVGRSDPTSSSSDAMSTGGVSECENVVCDSPPAATCIGNTYRTYAETGTCDAGSCSYQNIDETCYACRASGCYCPVGTAVSGSSCAECNAGTFSATTDAATCTPHRVCDAGSYVFSNGSRTTNRECRPCPEGTYSTDENSNNCTPHTACVAPYEEVTPPADTRDRVCICPQSCDDGRCLSASQCCEPATLGRLSEISGVNVTEVTSFCVEVAVRVKLSGGAGGPPGGAASPIASAYVYDASGSALGGFSGSNNTVYVNVGPGSYEVISTVSPGEGSGGVVVDLQDPDSEI